MSILDIILLICLVPAIVQGFRKGFISQVMSIVSVIAGVWLSVKAATPVSAWIGQYIHGSEQVLKIISFALIYIGVAFAMGALCRILEGIIKIIMLGWLNRLLGMLFSLLNACLIIGLVIMAFCSLNNTFNIVSEEILNQSVLFQPLKQVAYTVFPYLKEFLFWNN